MSALLEVDGLYTEFRTSRGIVHAVNGVSFAIAEGELVGVVGETGCGKSVTARSILRLIRPPGRVAAGSVRFRGVELTTLPERKLRKLRGSGLSFVPQNPFGSLNPVLPIGAQFRNVVNAHSSRPRGEIRQLALEALRRVGIVSPERVLDGYAHQLSGGMAQRVVIAIAMALGPRLVIADEPTTGLDVTIQRQILDLVAQLSRDDGRAMMLVTHDLGVVAQYCSRVIVMYAGTVVESGLVERVFVTPAHPYTEALLAAVPRPGYPLRKLLGTVPDLVRYPEGCPFQERCAHVEERCRVSRPELRELRDGRQLACHLAEGVIADGAAHAQ